jgi:hypothetical protein
MINNFLLKYKNEYRKNHMISHLMLFALFHWLQFIWIKFEFKISCLNSKAF